ncbi:MAG TPA: transglycosylase SLT domain-containing protein [Caulobacteraceae bacterium]
MVLHPQGVVDVAILRAADATGVDFGFLLGAARRESGFDPAARAQSSSAVGLFQFVEQTWLATLKRHGAEHGYARYAELIVRAPDGRYRTVDAEARRAVMALRLDPHAAALMAGEMAADHAAWLRQKIGRNPTPGELYVAHFLGQDGTARLIEAVRVNPEADAAALFPAPARTNPTIFRRAGRSLTAAELYADLTTTPAPASQGGDATFLRYAAARRSQGLRRSEPAPVFTLRGREQADGAPMLASNTPHARRRV